MTVCFQNDISHNTISLCSVNVVFPACLFQENSFAHSRVAFRYDEQYDDKYFLDSQRACADIPPSVTAQHHSFCQPRSTRPPSYKRSSHIPVGKPVIERHRVEMYNAEGMHPPVTIEGSMFNKGAFSISRIGNPHSDATDKVWSNGVVSYKQPNYAASLRLDFSTMSLNEQLNHAQSVGRFHSRDLSPYEIKRLQKQEELM